MDQITKHFSEAVCQRLARKTGFQKRQPRKVSALLMLRALSLPSSRRSLEMLACAVGFLGGEPVSKQAMAKRFSGACVEFFRHALFAVLGSVAGVWQVRQKGAFESFSRVLIEDSTTLPLHPRLASAFPGARNHTAKITAAAKIQATYDLLSERFVRFSLSAFTRNDQAASQDALEWAEPGDLILRDLGYFVCSVFAELHRRGVFFLSRLRSQTTLFDQDGQPFDLLRQLRRHGKLDIHVLMGNQNRVPVRLVAIPLSQSQADARRRKAKRNRDRRCLPSKRSLALLDWEILITNVPQKTWSPETTSQVYGLRWRIETLFKAWKSHFHIDDLPQGSSHQITTMIYARLLSICLFQTSFSALAQGIHQNTSRHLSLLRLSAFLSHFNDLIALHTQNPVGTALIHSLIAKHCCYQNRSDRLSHPEILQTLS